jgi:beta-lactamase class C
MQRRQFNLVAVSSPLSSRLVGAGVFGLPSLAAAKSDTRALEGTVRAAVEPVMAQFALPGVAVAVSHRGNRGFFNFGTAELGTQRSVSEQTLFEIGSISKLFTATLGAYAEATGALKLSDKASQHMPSLRGSAFDAVSLQDLATYTAGGLPLQFPAGVTEANVMDYFRQWKPKYAPGTTRVYSNPSIGLFGRIAAQALNAPFAEALEGKLLGPMGLANTFVRVPPSRMADYAWGDDDGKPMRVGRGVMDYESYGIKTSAADLLRFLELSMDASALPADLSLAIGATQEGRFRVGQTTQALVWEGYAMPATLQTLIEGNSDALSHRPRTAKPLLASTHRNAPMLLNKTGGTNGFCAYTMLAHSQQLGIVLLCNKPFPREHRIGIAHQVMRVVTQGKG